MYMSPHGSALYGANREAAAGATGGGTNVERSDT